MGRDEQLRNKKDKKTKNGKNGKAGKGKKRKASNDSKPKSKPGAKAQKLLRSAKKSTEDLDVENMRPPKADAGAAPAVVPKAKAKAKAKAKSSPKAKAICKKPAANDKNEPPKKRVRRKTTQQEQQWELDEKFYDEELYEAIQEYVYKFSPDDAGSQFKKKVKYNLNFQMLHCSIDPYYSRQSCVTTAPKDITADGKDTSWCFSFHGDSEKGGPHWQFEMACSIICAHLLAPRLKPLKWNPILCNYFVPRC